MLVMYSLVWGGALMVDQTLSILVLTNSSPAWVPHVTATRVPFTTRARQ